MQTLACQILRYAAFIDVALRVLGTYHCYCVPRWAGRPDGDLPVPSVRSAYRRPLARVCRVAPLSRLSAGWAGPGL